MSACHCPDCERQEDEAILVAIELHDRGLSFDEIGAILHVAPAWAADACMMVFEIEAEDQRLH